MKKNILIGLICCVAFAFLIGGVIPTGNRVVSASTPGGIFLFNPYRGVDWDNVGRYRAQFHAHTTTSDGRSAPADTIATYQSLGFHFLAIADHDYVTYPWADYGHVPTPEPWGPFEGNLIQAIQANEQSGHDIWNDFFRANPTERRRTNTIHHIVQMFSDYVDAGWHENTRDLMDAATAHNNRSGRFFLAHPERYVGRNNLANLDNPNHQFNLAWYVDMLERFPTLLGVEIYNQNDRYSNDRRIWDRILSETMPQRPAWGFAASDNHGSHYGWNYTSLLLPEPTVDNVRCAIERGAFFSHSFRGLNPSTLDLQAMRIGGRYDFMPEIDRINVDQTTGYITIDARQYTEIIWITNNGFEAGRGESVNFRTNPMVSRFLRAIVINELDDGHTVATYTQPFGVGEFDEDSWFFYFAGVDFGAQPEIEERPESGCQSGCGSSVVAGGLIAALAGGAAALFVAWKKR